MITHQVKTQISAQGSKKSSRIHLQNWVEIYLLNPDELQSAYQSELLVSPLFPFCAQLLLLTITVLVRNVQQMAAKALVAQVKALSPKTKAFVWVNLALVYTIKACIGGN